MESPEQHPAARDDLRDMVERLAAARRESATARESARIAREANEAAFQAQCAQILTTEADAKLAVNSAEQALRGFALAFYEMTAEKKPVAGVEVVMTSEFTVDEVIGLAWAKQTGMALIPERLDVKAVQKIARATPLPFVTETKVPGVRIAANLDAELAEVAVP